MEWVIKFKGKEIDMGGVLLILLLVGFFALLLFASIRKEKLCEPMRGQFEGLCKDICNSYKMDYGDFFDEVENGECVVYYCGCYEESCDIDEDFKGFRLTSGCNRDYHRIYVDKDD